MYKRLSGYALTLLAVLLIGGGIASMMYGKETMRKSPNSSTEQFIEQHMINTNGTLASYLQDGTSTVPEIAAGREALSESLGLWMQYALLRQDKPLFDRSYDVLKERFIMPEGYIAWKLAEDGKSNVHTNALGDDFRIIDALWKAADQWNEESYRVTADELTGTLVASAMREGWFVDYHDFSRNESSSALSLAYLDMSALSNMTRNGVLEPSVYERHKKLLTDMPDDGLFYPKSYQIDQKTYIYDDSVNLIDQLLVALNGAEIGRTSDKLVTFLKTEFEQRHRIIGRYNRDTRQPDAAYESPSVYALAILLALKSGDTEFARQLDERMLAFRGQDADYPGGYVFSKDTHIFDNLFPLIAEESVQENQ
ncbi:glycosyl hydrolase [Paenibacillus sp. P96]|uniref:Glycosyl hydrolase n=1 Tax=Paenibacillus zeirhizosphaerae TaxID=2987519 RepID=A0ABT9FXJ4_9BACL|nr:glycosyl hydrolase [Paenibacillus sp. P96]MDP4099448.1 glycosyl hydrolase [Paenibacillus sp. P96]